MAKKAVLRHRFFVERYNMSHIILERHAKQQKCPFLPMERAFCYTYEKPKIHFGARDWT